MQLRYTYRFYPDRGQRAALARLFGCVRVVFNDALARQKPLKASNKLLGSPKKRVAEGPYQRVPKNPDLSRELITRAKQTPEREWLGQVSAVPLQQVLRDLDKAWAAHEDSKTGKRQGPKVGAPRFKSRRDRTQSARFTANARWKITDAGKLSLPRIGEVKVNWSRELPSAPSSVTVIKDAADRYFASFVVETNASEVLPETTPEVGIDLGLSHFAVLSDGTKVANPRFLRRAERKLKKAQRALSRKTKGSNNRNKARLKVARVHMRVADARKDFHHQLSTTIIRENQAVYVEDLCVKGLGRSRLAKSVHDAGWSAFVHMLEYKATRYGRFFAKVDRFLASSQTCSQCWAVDGPKPLHVRQWTCTACETLHDRDVNASRIVLAAGRADRENACGGTVRPAA
ncbi:RNA-guided endonuclease InsQ/TnpB family protein [Nocardiopsis metallicus]|uniref:Putative transposase n=1 Tax=Nocardiopsis metallicus TaxID=179819 RepID=A0A840WR97_9ACTN|nr:RNA-guided endonuclease TnpB family protein [Nocardiopsis metallicus]MBB5494405.1 putative transposase [Nocardiopsis metallicus]